jgi:hypothetical protein
MRPATIRRWLILVLDLRLAAASRSMSRSKDVVHSAGGAINGATVTARSQGMTAEDDAHASAGWPGSEFA